jgi:hypothetical protein
VGIIDTLTAGFDLVRRKPWLVLLPVLLDVGLWMAPKLSIAALTSGLMKTALPQVSAYSGAAANLPESVQAMQEMAAGINLTSLVASGYLNIPSLVISSARNPFGLARPIVEVPGLLSFCGWLAGLSLVGLIAGTLYLTPIAEGARDGEVDWRGILGRLPGNLARLLGAFVLTSVIMTFILLPMSLSLGLFGLLSQGLASLTAGFGVVAMLWVLLYLAFVPQAILLGRTGVLQAVGQSINVVRMSFWSTLGLLFLVNVIGAGLGFVWDRLTVTTWGAFVAIIANAFVGTGLTAAVFIFYRERMRAWEQLIKQLRSQA